MLVSLTGTTVQRKRANEQVSLSNSNTEARQQLSRPCRALMPLLNSLVGVKTV